MVSIIRNGGRAQSRRGRSNSILAVFELAAVFSVSGWPHAEHESRGAKQHAAVCQEERALGKKIDTGMHRCISWAALATGLFWNCWFYRSAGAGYVSFIS